MKIYRHSWHKFIELFTTMRAKLNSSKQSAEITKDLSLLMIIKKQKVKPFKKLLGSLGKITRN